MTIPAPLRRAASATLAALIAGVSAPPAPAAYPSPADWRDECMYQIITDRWENGDPSNDALGTTYAPAAGASTHGGDFKGLVRRFPYLKGLGVTAVWISPIANNAYGEYHGYAADDFTTTAKHWGPVEDLKQFISLCHASGIKVVLDVVCNHGGDLIRNNSYRASPPYTLSWSNVAKQHKAPFNSLSYFHPYGSIGNYSDPEQILGELANLDDLITEDATVRSKMITVWSDWITNLDIDAYRIDTVKHVEIGFWQTWTPGVRANASAFGKSNFFFFGEVFDGDEAKVGYYTGTKAGGAYALDSNLDYNQFYQTNNVFATATRGAQDLVDHWNRLPTYYDPAASYRLVTNLDNHDNPRFLSSGLANGNRDRLWAALVYQLTSLGIPCVYYGTEQAFDGGNDPADREDMFDGQYEQGPSLGDNFDQTAFGYRLMRRLNQFRRDHVALRRGTATARQVSGSAGVFAYSRVSGASEALIAINTGGTFQNAARWQTGWPAGTVVRDRLDPTYTATIDATGGVPASTPMLPRGTRLFVPDSQITDLEPETLSAAPARGAFATSITTALVLTFSEPMVRSALEAATTASALGAPVAPLTFAWNGASDSVAILPASGAWPGTARVTVAVGEGAVDQSGGLPLRGGFETFFDTPSIPDTTGIDGTITGDGRYGSPVAVQTVQTQFGNATAGLADSNAAGSELDALYVADDAAYLYVAVAGNLELNGNLITVFLDTDYDGTNGGVSTLTDGASTFLTGNSDAGAKGTKMPAGMKADLAVQVGLGAPGQTLTLSAYRWNAAGALTGEGIVGTLGGVSGQATKGPVSGTVAGQAVTFRAGMDNRNTGPVAGGSGVASPTGAAAATGLELRIPKSLAGPGPYKVFAGLSGSSGYWSNQFLPPLAPARANLTYTPDLGALGVTAVTYVATPAVLTGFAVE